MFSINQEQKQANLTRERHIHQIVPGTALSHNSHYVYC